MYYEEYEDKTLGRKREIFLKSGQGRLYLKNRLKELESWAVSPAEGGSLPDNWQAGASGGKTLYREVPRVRIPASPLLSEEQWP